VTLGLSLIITNATTMILTPTPRGIRTTYATQAFALGPVLLNQARAYAFVMALVLAAAVYLFLTRTDLGKALRAAADDPEAAGYQGIDVPTMHGVAFGVGIALVASAGADHTAIESAGLGLIAIAALVRKGIVPFHAWVPEVFDHGRLGPAILFSAPQVGAYMTVVLIVPRASPELLRLIAVLALVTAVYGAALALVQASARRACGYLFMSQSALVMAGLDCTSAGALAGGLLVWLSAGLAFAGLARCVLVLEARRGRLDLTTYHGGFDRMPVLAIAFLTTGLACTGFPGTLGFVGQELLVSGAVEAFPVMGFAIVIASALTGLAVIRMYFSLFCGRPDSSSHAVLRLGLTPREAWTFVALVVALFGFGLVPRPLVDSRFAASEHLLRVRQANVSTPHSQL